MENEAVAILELDAEEDEQETCEQWKDDSMKAFGVLDSGCEDSQYVYFKQKETVREAWHALKDQHQHVSVGSRVRIYKRLCTHRLVMGGSMQQHIDEMFQMFDQLNELDSAIDNTIAVGTLLASLSEEYDEVVTAMECWDE